MAILLHFFFFSSRRRHTRWNCDWSSDVCSSDLLARWVAEDRLAALEFGREWPALDVKEGDADMGGHAFRWRQETGATPVARLRRVEVSVFLPGADSPLAKLTGFVEQTGPQPGSQTGPGTGPQLGPQTGSAR